MKALKIKKEDLGRGTIFGEGRKCILGYIYEKETGNKIVSIYNSEIITCKTKLKEAPTFTCNVDDIYTFLGKRIGKDTVTSLWKTNDAKNYDKLVELCKRIGYNLTWL